MVQHREGGSFGPAGDHGVVDSIAGQLEVDGGAGEKSDPGDAEQGGDEEDDIDHFPHCKTPGDLAHEYGGDGHPRHPAAHIEAGPPAAPAVPGGGGGPKSHLEEVGQITAEAFAGQIQKIGSGSADQHKDAHDQIDLGVDGGKDPDSVHHSGSGGDDKGSHDDHAADDVQVIAVGDAGQVADAAA